MPRRAGFFELYGRAVIFVTAAALVVSLVFAWRPVKRYWTAASSLIRAGAIKIVQEHDRPVARSPENEKNFGELCRLSLEAYKNNAGVFKLSGIIRAQTGCRLSGNRTAEQTFIRFERNYRKEHPDEI